MARKAMPMTLRKGLADVGRGLSEWRRLLGLSVAQLALQAEVSESTVARIENGEGASLENVLRVARAMGVLDRVLQGFDPWEDDRGKMLISAHLPKRAERRAGQ